MTSKGTALTYFKVKALDLIPEALLEQSEMVKAERLVALAPLLEQSPFCDIGVFVDKAKIIKGFMITVADPFMETISLAACGIANDFKDTKFLSEVRGIMEKIARKKECGKIAVQTRRVDDFADAGFAPSDAVMLEAEVSYVG